MKDLVFIEPVNKKMEPYTTDEIIAECAGVKLPTVQRLIREKKERLEAFGVLRFEIRKPMAGSIGGRPIKTYHLNEQQATLIITFLRNTEAVTQFKVELVRQFFDMRGELEMRRHIRAEGKPVRRALTDAVRDSGENERMHGHAYKAYTDMIYKAVAGKTAKQLKKERSAPGMAAADLLTAQELAAYKRKETAVAALLDEGFRYDDIKGILWISPGQREAGRDKKGAPQNWGAI